MPQPKIIIQDGKRYEFTPGQNGSLIARPQGQPLPVPSFLQDLAKKQASAKVIGPDSETPPEQLALRRKLLDRR